VRVLFVSTRGAGHFNPLVPFIEACRRNGHELLVAGPPSLGPAVEAAGYPFRAGADPPKEELPMAAAIYQTALEAVAGLPARILLTVGRAGDPSAYRAVAGHVAEEMRALPPVDDALAALAP
jgi:UDP:flavonoid glycosyltransferase YjiC (YdhE family)